MPPTPQHCPTPRELDDLELLTSGALAPLTGFNLASSPVTLQLPADLADAEVVELVDPEGLPLALFTPATGAVESLTHPQYGPFRRLYLSPAQVREQYAGSTFVPVTGPLTTADIASLRSLDRVVLLALCGAGRPGLTTVGLLRATLAAATLLGDVPVVAAPLAWHGDTEADGALRDTVVGNYAGPDPVHWPLEQAGERPATIAEIVEQDQPAADEQGLVLFFTGLSGSGKSTLARALMDRILEQGKRTVTSLDGDVVRRHLSAGLTFSKEDRETNIRRIGWVAAEISRHGGLAVCSPIAPFAETRRQVREMVEAAGGAFFLVHVATPLEECERRDRKGLYAKARRGEIPEFTGISSPYEEPDDAAVRVDTTGRTIEDALDDVIEGLAASGHLDLREAAAEAADDEPPLKILFVCTANICRSPFMEIVARQLAGTGASVVFSSAGTQGWREHAMDEVMSGNLVDYEVDGPGDFKSRPLTLDLIRDADLVLTAEAAHRAYILEDDPTLFRKVFTLGQFAETLRHAPTTATGRDLVREVAANRESADPSLDVPDPYRQGPEASRRTAQIIAEHLRVVVPALLGHGRIHP